MRTAQKQQVVAFKTFLRTLIHELCHHLDYELFALEETFHTEGFYKRESSARRGAARAGRGRDRSTAAVTSTLPPWRAPRLRYNLPLPEERCNRVLRRSSAPPVPARLGALPLQRRSLNRGSRAG